MSILVDRSSRILIQGVTGSIGRSFARRMVEFDTPLVGGVTPGRGGQDVEGRPVFDTVADAVRVTGATCSLIVVPAPAVLDAVIEAADANIPLAVIYTEGVPVQDVMRSCAYARSRNMMLCGPNSAGIVSPGEANLSDLNDYNLTPGPVGIVSKSGTLTYEVILDLRQRGVGVSTVVCLGGDPVVGLGHRTVLPMFDRDPQTRAVVLIGEIGGRMEVEAADAIAAMSKPVVAFVAGRFAPQGKQMGHAGAIVGDAAETADSKLGVLQAAGARPVPLLTDVGSIVHQILSMVAR